MNQSESTNLVADTQYTVPADISAELRDYIDSHSSILHPTSHHKIHCTITNTDLSYNFELITRHVQGKKFKQCQKQQLLDSDQYKQLLDEYCIHVQPHYKSAHQLYCTLTRTTINNDYNELLNHINGKQFKTRLQQYNRKQELKAKRKHDKLLSNSTSNNVSDSESDDHNSQYDNHTTQNNHDDVWTRVPAALFENELIDDSSVTMVHKASNQSNNDSEYTAVNDINDMIELGVVDNDDADNILTHSDKLQRSFERDQSRCAPNIHRYKVRKTQENARARNNTDLRTKYNKQSHDKSTKRSAPSHESHPTATSNHHITNPSVPTHTGAITRQTTKLVTSTISQTESTQIAAQIKRPKSFSEFNDGTDYILTDRKRAVDW